VSKKQRNLTSEEKSLWQRVASTVKSRKPLPADDEPEVEAPRPRAKTAHAPEPSSRAVKRPSSGPAPPADRGGEKRVRRGKLEIGGTLDLHGYHQDSGRNALIRFLLSAYARGDRTVIVVTGVGRSGQGVLRQRLPEWLGDRDVKAIVAGYAQAHRTHGGAGAFYVFLKAKRGG
jgi:DNA-nicking Smr family endonuclease